MRDKGRAGCLQRQQSDKVKTRRPKIQDIKYQFKIKKKKMEMDERLNAIKRIRAIKKIKEAITS